MRFYIADTHFGHANIIKYCGRPFTSADEMNEVLVRNWNSVVSWDDEVYILGDFSLAGVEQVQKYLSLLSGKKFLVRGNHDRKNSGMRHLFEKVYDRGFYRQLNGTQYYFTHYPPDNDTDQVIYGHIHDNGIGDARCVCVENTNYFPISEKELEKRLTKSWNYDII